MSWDTFLQQIADCQGIFDADDRQVFCWRFAEQNWAELDAKIADNLHISEATLQRRMGRIYATFAHSCPALNTEKKGKFKRLRDWLKREYVRYQQHGEQLRNLETDSGAIATPLCQDRYIEPGILPTCYQEILKPGCLLRIKAPWKMGKTELMSRVLNYAADQGYRAVSLNLRDATATDFQDLNRFLQWFCTSVTLSLNQESLSDNPVAEHWQKSIGNSKNKCKTYFEKHLLPGDSCLVLGLDEVDRIFPYPEIAGEFLGMLRTRHEEAKTRPIWGKLRQVLVYTEDYRELDINQSPFNTGLPIALPELSREQVQALAQDYGLDWQIDQVNRLMAMVGGQPYLVQEAMKQIGQKLVTLEEVLATAATPRGIYRDYLLMYGQKLHQSPELVAAFNQVVGVNHSVRLNLEVADVLENLGLVRWEGDGVSPRYELFRRYFESRIESGG
ncbi:MAG: AAA-like domain-containing protein [Coleofasciculus sp. A1-SPW-01]|uniref:AAA-like domain-containing protein n=1 Tax=Coleofasciculus sp. A1-SPW-01 TaxID=3070819 RepID=UPI0032FF7DD2